MADQAALALARAIHARGESIGGLNGSLPAAEVMAGELARLQGGRVEVAQHTRLFELGRAAAADGRAGQASRRPPSTTSSSPGPGSTASCTTPTCRPAATPTPTAARRSSPRTSGVGSRRGAYWFWLDEAEERVHLTGANPPAFGVARIGPVYTPPEQRRKGYAGAAVAAGLTAAPRRRRPGLPLHRPGQPDVERHLPGDRLPARRRPGEPADRHRLLEWRAVNDQPRLAQTFAEVEDALLSRWPETRMEPSLDRIRAFTELLGDPQRGYPVIHLTGTNGKTSTARMIDTLLRALELRTGRFTSPHVERMTERISLDGEQLTDEQFVRSVQRRGAVHPPRRRRASPTRCRSSRRSSRWRTPRSPTPRSTSRSSRSGSAGPGTPPTSPTPPWPSCSRSPSTTRTCSATTRSPSRRRRPGSSSPARSPWSPSSCPTSPT